MEKGFLRRPATKFIGHLNTMYVELMRKLKKKDLQEKNRRIPIACNDAAFMTPTL